MIDSLETQNNLAIIDEPSSPAPQTAEPPQQITPFRNIKEIIFNYTVGIHDSHKANKDLSRRQLHAMATGVSCILNINEEAQSSLFSEQIWSKLQLKYTTRFIISPVTMTKSYHWGEKYRL
ncbi:hypothetical protein K501DRAFT_270487 [Backusella circina FSU 941]|nr:hypothetical protein K501DRAFT_270487 [Backusella circina FSU 941]